MEFDKWQEVINTNLSSVFLTSKRAIGPMISQKDGVIINMSSIWGREGAALEACYSATKGAINSFTKALSKELSPSNIRVNAIAPGVVLTDMMKEDFSKRELDLIKEDIGMGRLADPKEIADLIAFLISDEASYITGSIIDINGGFY